MDNGTKSVGKIIFDRRTALSLTQKDVADYVGVSEATVSRWESGHIDNMRRDRIAKLAKILRISPLVIMGVDEPASSAPPAPQKSGGLPERDRTANGGPAHASAREMHQLEKILAEPNLTYNGVALGAEDIEKINRALELAFWDAKGKNKRKK